MIKKAMLRSGLSRIFLPLLLVTAGLLGLTMSAQAQLVWSDEFDTGSAPAATVWSYDLGSGGWGNSELQTYTDDPANVRIEGGYLYITAVETLSTRGKRTTKTYTSARIKTEDKLTYKYGTMEARIMTPDLADGLWPAFWTLGNNFSSVGWPDCGEIDVMEMGNVNAINDGVVNRRVGSTAHWEVNNGYANYGLTYDAPSDLNGSFHVYRVDWTPTEISTYIDNTWIWTIDISDPSSFDGDEFHKPHFVILNLAVGGTYTGITNSSNITAPFPAEYVIDYVRIYDNGYTVLGGSSIDGGGPGGGTEAHVDSITPGASGGGRKKKANATIVIVDDNGDPVDGAVVTASFSGSHNQTVSGTTGSNGSVSLQTSVTNSSAAFTVCVDDVSSALTYNAAANVETCDTF
jgi:beta-glucanase (GH16 family)